MSKVENISETRILVPQENTMYIQTNDTCSTLILHENFSFPIRRTPSKSFMFYIQTGTSGIYLLNNSNTSYIGCRYLMPNKIYTFTFIVKNNKKYLFADGYDGDSNIIIDWSIFFNSKVTGAPPLSSRKYAIFINGVYNALLAHKNLFDQSVGNETAKLLSATLLPGIDTSIIYDKYPKLEQSDKNTIETFVTTYLNKETSKINAAALNPAYSLPEEAKTKWKGLNPVLPNWNTNNLPYFSNTFTSIPHDPQSSMENDAKELLQIRRTTVTDEIAKHFAKGPPPAHLVEIACSILGNKQLSTIELSKILSVISISVADAGLFAWTAKYTYWGARPFQYITNYKPLIATPNFPGYISGHSTFSGAWDTTFSMLVPSVKNISKYIADLSGISRLYGGIHFSDDNITGLDCGRKIGNSVYLALLSKINANEPFL